MWIGGLGLGESPSERTEAVEASLGALPPALLRLAACGDGPLAMLRLVLAGVDVVDSDYPHLLTQFGYVACFAIEPSDVRAAPAGGAAGAAAGASVGAAGVDRGAGAAAGAAVAPGTAPVTLCGDATKFNARDRGMALDPAPLVPGCTCYACRTHSRAYVHHLLNVHEMLAPTLLQCHNTHHFLRLFQRVRAEVAADTLPAYLRWFADVNGIHE